MVFLRVCNLFLAVTSQDEFWRSSGDCHEACPVTLIARISPPKRMNERMKCSKCARNTYHSVHQINMCIYIIDTWKVEGVLRKLWVSIQSLTLGGPPYNTPMSQNPSELGPFQARMPRNTLRCVGYRSRPSPARCLEDHPPPVEKTRRKVFVHSASSSSSDAACGRRVQSRHGPRVSGSRRSVPGAARGQDTKVMSECPGGRRKTSDTGCFWGLVGG
jgi:hypothetical protein